MLSDSTSRARKLLANTAWIVVVLLMMSVTATKLEFQMMVVLGTALKLRMLLKRASVQSRYSSIS
jgi:hypothetical protein